MKNYYYLLLIGLFVSCSDVNLDEYDEIESVKTPRLEVTKSYNEIPLNGRDWYRIHESISWGHGTMVYTVGSSKYLLYPGGGYNDTESGYPILFKEIDGKWVYLKSFLEIPMEGIRNHRVINETTFLWGEASENYNCDTCSIARPSNAWIVKVVTDDVIFTKINEEPNWFHDISFGDLDNDGLYDIVWNSDKVYFQNQDGTFRLEHDVFPSTYGTVYFSIEIGNLFGDERPEVVKTAYVDPEHDYQVNGFYIYQFNDATRKMEKVYQSNTPHALIKERGFGGSHTRIVDINNDGYNDLIIEREGLSVDYSRVVEVWIGDGTPNLKPYDLVHNNDRTRVIGFELFDVNNDGYADIIFKGEAEGSVRIDQNDWGAGFRLNDLIFINDGSGKFSKYNDRDLIGGVGSEFGQFFPYMNNGNLSFHGGVTDPMQGKDSARVVIYTVTLYNL